MTNSSVYVYHSMATGFCEGRVGQVDLAALRRRADVKNPWEPFDRLPPEATHRWVSFYTLDIGYSLIVEAARLAFPTLPDNHLRALALQLVFDAAMVFFVCFIFAQWHVVLGLLTAYLYVSNGPFYNLVSFPYYYYWDIPIAFIVLGALLLACRRPAEGRAWLILAALALGFGVWLRGSWWPIAFFLFGLAAATPRYEGSCSSRRSCLRSSRRPRSLERRGPAASLSHRSHLTAKLTWAARSAAS